LFYLDASPEQGQCMRMAAVADNEDLRLEGISIGVGLRVAPGITKAEAERFIKENAEAFCRGRRLAGVGLAWLLWRVSGTGNQIAGKVKRGVGQAFGDDKLQGSGVVDQVKGAAQDLAGKATQTVRDTAQDLKS